MKMKNKAVMVRFGEQLRSCEVISFNQRSKMASVRFVGSDGHYHGRHVHIRDVEHPEDRTKIEEWERGGELPVY